MAYSLEPAYTVRNQLTRKLVQASIDYKNQWFFTDGAFSADQIVEYQPNTWLKDDFVVISNNKIIAFFSAQWNNPLRIISSLRIIFFDKTKTIDCVKAVFDYFDYLFISRGCEVINWLVADKNTHAKCIYHKFTQHYFGHIVGHRTRGQMSYSGDISNVTLFEITKEDFFNWKKRMSTNDNRILYP